MEDVFGFADDLGPAKVIHLFGARSGLKAVVVIDNVAAGPAIGGVRMAPDATALEAFRLARAMSLKSAAVELPHGGAKSVIMADPKMDPAAKEALMRAFARAIRDLTEYIPAPDMGTDERCMAFVHDETGRACGLPREMGGLPLDELGATGFGLAVSVEEACQFVDFDLNGARVAVQGFGAVGRNAARFLAQRGAVLVAVADSGGTVSDPGGLNLDGLLAVKDAGGSVATYDGGEHGPVEAILGVECEIWIPAARPDVITEKNVQLLKTRLVAQGANIPVTPMAENMLNAVGVSYIPDIIANSGGLICAAAEFQGLTEAAAFQMIEEKIRANTRAVLHKASRQMVTARQAATAMAKARILSAMETKGGM